MNTAPPRGAEWDTADEAEIVSRARALGWTN